MSSQFSSSSLLDEVMSSACQGDRWQELLEELSKGTQQQLQELVGSADKDSTGSSRPKRFAELNDAVQSAIVERQMHELQQQKSTVLKSFNQGLMRACDEYLIKCLETNESQKSLLRRLVDLSTDCASAALLGDPPLLASAQTHTHTHTLKLFLNRPIPASLRVSVWASLLRASAVDMPKTLVTGRLPPATDVLISRRCLSLLDNFFPDISTRVIAAVIKEVIVIALKTHGIPLPTKEDDCSTLDQLFFLAVPLVSVFVVSTGSKSSGSVISYASSGDSIGSVSIEQPHAALSVARALMCMAGPRHLSLSAEMKSLVPSSPALAKTISLLESKDPNFIKMLLALRRDYFFSASSSSSSSSTASTSVSASSKLQAESELEFPPNTLAESSTHFSEYLDEHLKRGLMALLPLDTCLFVWDQCLVAGSGMMLPLCLTALVMGAEPRLRNLTLLTNATDVFYSYCRCVQIRALQRLITVHCGSELIEGE